MPFSPKPAESRREFFRATVRYGLLGLLSAGVAALAARPRILAGQHCVNQGICSSCSLFTACKLPQALSAQRANDKG